MTILNNLIEDLKKSEARLKHVVDAQASLRLAGLEPILTQLGRASTVGVQGDVQILATRAAFSDGYMTALDDILNFREKYIQPVLSDRAGMSKHPVRPSFGANTSVLMNDLLTQDELETVLNNRGG